MRKSKNSNGNSNFQSRILKTWCHCRTNRRVSSYKTKQPLPPVPSKASDSKGAIPGRPPRSAAVSNNNVIATLQAIKSAFQNFRKIDEEFMNFLESEQTAPKDFDSKFNGMSSSRKFLPILPEWKNYYVPVSESFRQIVND